MGVQKAKGRSRAHQKTLDMEHTAALGRLGKQRGEASALSMERDALRVMLSELTSRPRMTLQQEELQQLLDAKDALVALDEQISSLSSASDDVEYFLKTGGILFQYYDILDKGAPPSSSAGGQPVFDKSESYSCNSCDSSCEKRESHSCNENSCNEKRDSCEKSPACAAAPQAPVSAPRPAPGGGGLGGGGGGLGGGGSILRFFSAGGNAGKRVAEPEAPPAAAVLNPASRQDSCQPSAGADADTASQVSMANYMHDLNELGASSTLSTPLDPSSSTKPSSARKTSTLQCAPGRSDDRASLLEKYLSCTDPDYMRHDGCERLIDTTNSYSHSLTLSLSLNSNKDSRDGKGQAQVGQAQGQGLVGQAPPIGQVYHNTYGVHQGPAKRDPNEPEQRAGSGAAGGHCQHCGTTDRTVMLHDGYIFCNRCFTLEYVLVDHEKPSYKDPPKEITYFAYKRINHFNEWLNQVQGKETTDIPDEVYDKILLEIKKQKITNMADLTNAKVREILKKLRINKYYEHIPHIINRLSGVSMPHIPPDLEDRLRHMFCQIQVPFLKHSPPTRKNFLSYSYVLHKFMQLLDKDQYVHSFPLLKSRDKLICQDQIWAKICEELGWEFVRSL